MLSINPRQDLFKFRFPDTFFNASILAKYDSFLKQYPSVITDMKTLVNEAILEVSLPELSYTPLEQQTPKKQSNNPAISVSPNYSRGNENVQNVVQKTFTVSVRHTEAYLTYFCLLEHFYNAYDFQNTNKKNFGTFPVQTLTAEGYATMTINFEKVLFTGLSGLPLSYANTDRSFQTFDCTFFFSTFNTTITLPELNLKQS